jgi:plastocyanin
MLLGALAASCGGSGTPDAPTLPSSNTLTITAAGVNPKELTVAPGSRVTFVNSDSRAHNMTSDPHPEHDDCPEINVGVLSPGQSRESLNLVTVRTCGFHDHDNPDNNGLKGRIVIR